MAPPLQLNRVSAILRIKIEGGFMSLSNVLAKPKGPIVSNPSTEKPAPKGPTKEEKGGSPTPTDRSSGASKSNANLRVVVGGGNPKKVGTPSTPPVKKQVTPEDFKKAIAALKQPDSKAPSFADGASKAEKAAPKMDFKSTPDGGTKSTGSAGGKDESVKARVETTTGDRAPKLGERGPNARYPRTYAPSAPEARGK
jgi:hypothetical protein